LLAAVLNCLYRKRPTLLPTEDANFSTDSGVMIKPALSPHFLIRRTQGESAFSVSWSFFRDTTFLVRS